MRVFACSGIATILPTTDRSTSRNCDLIQSGAAPPPQAGERVPWKTLLLNPTIIALFCSYFASGFGFQFFVTWLPTYLMREHGLTLQRSGFLAGLPLAAGAVGCLMGGVIADWITRRTGSVTIGRRSVGVSGFLLGAVGYTAAIYGHSAGAAIAFWRWPVERMT